MNPYSRIGIDKETVLFLETLLIYCFVKQGQNFTNDEIRNINHNDLKDLFEWRNNYESRKQFLNNNKINLKEHQKWFEESMKNPSKVRIF